MSDANATAFVLKEETTYGTAATGAGGFVIVPTSDSIEPTQGFTDSQRIRSDGQNDDTIRNSVGAGGDHNVEFSYGDPYNGLLQLALRNNYTDFGVFGDETVRALRVQSTTTSVTSTSVFTRSDNWTTAGPAVGSFLKVQGFDNAANNGLFRVTASTATTATVAETLVVEAASASKTITVLELQGMMANDVVDASASGFNPDTGSWTVTPSVGDWLYVAGFSNAGNNGFFKVTAVTASDVTTSPAPSGGAETGNNVNMVIIGHSENGPPTALKSWTHEKVFDDAAGVGTDIVDRFVGGCLGGMSMTIPPDGPITGAFSWSFQKQDQTGSSATVTATYPHSPNRIFNGIDYVNAIWMGGVAVTPTSISFQTNINLRPRNVIGQLGPISMGSGVFTATGTVQVYLADNVEYVKALADTVSSMAFALEDDDGNALIFDFPNTHYTNFRRVAGGVNTDVIAEFQFTATRSATENITMRVAKL